MTDTTPTRTVRASIVAAMAHISDAIEAARGDHGTVRDLAGVNITLLRLYEQGKEGGGRFEESSTGVIALAPRHVDTDTTAVLTSALGNEGLPS